MKLIGVGPNPARLMFLEDCHTEKKDHVKTKGISGHLWAKERGEGAQK